MFNNMILFPALLVASTLGLESNSSRISTSPVVIENANFSAAILWENNTFLCSASIVSKNCLLTTHHCSEHVGTFQARVGSVDNTKEGQLIAIKKFVGHESHNFALAVLEKTITFNTKVQPIKLVKQNTEDPVGKEVSVYGWNSNVLEMAKEEVLSIDACKKVKSEADESNLCYGKIKNLNTCSHAAFMSGGSCVYDNSLYGVSISTTKTSLLCSSDVGICMRVGFASDWIEEEIKKNSASNVLINIFLINALLLFAYSLSK